MTVVDGADVPLSALRPLKKIGDGGQGEVSTLDGQPHVLYKSYREPHLVNGDALSGLVSVRLALGPAERDQLDASAAWPLCRVVDEGRVTGFLMNEAPASMSWSTADGSTRLTEMAFLLRPAKAAWQGVIQPTPAERYGLLVALAELVDRLHATGLVVGDLSQANVLWTVRPAPAVHLLDCDGIRLSGSAPVLAQADTPDWNDPLAPPGTVTVDSDRYKAALAIGRILAQDAYVAPGRPLVPLPGVLDDRREAAVRALYDAAAGAYGTRPGLGQWRVALAGRAQVRLTAGQPRPRPALDPSKFEGPRSRGTIRLRD
ncbi:hypothetical protein [Streptomyces sp. NBC_00091]|uniref:hypothetical protein n=1 Tax=Streptomyces sp. NBC_00091 TaxID=2975648 RepID=UPI002254E4FB|nr:hypothetical protein [Streptomyces sp. NBC_00091]MCX5377982.1 hypothetical protein [Streptomyces sp. NBC_00091]